jgi:tetratricopeptide (TPR) repeat protein
VFRLAALFFLALGAAAGADIDPATLLKAGKADQALHALNTTLAHDPKDARAYNLLSRVYFQLELWDNSVRMAEKAIALDPQNSDYHLWLGRAMGRKAEEANPFAAFGMARKVKTEFERAVALDANNLPARSDLSEYYLEAPGFLGGDKNKARQQADYIAKRDRALASYIYARVEEKQGNTGAEAEYKKAIAASSQPGRYWVELAHFYRRAGRLADMETAINQSVAMAHPGEPTEFDSAALLVHTGRDFAGAAKMLRHYVSQDDPSEDGPAFRAHYLLGVVLEKLGRKKEAVAEFQAALDMAAEYRPAQDALARVSR